MRSSWRGRGALRRTPACPRVSSTGTRSGTATPPQDKHQREWSLRPERPRTWRGADLDDGVQRDIGVSGFNSFRWIWFSGGTFWFSQMVLNQDGRHTVFSVFLLWMFRHDINIPNVPRVVIGSAALNSRHFLGTRTGLEPSWGVNSMKDKCALV